MGTRWVVANCWAVPEVREATAARLLRWEALRPTANCAAMRPVPRMPKGSLGGECMVGVLVRAEGVGGSRGYGARRLPVLAFSISMPGYR